MGYLTILLIIAAVAISHCLYLAGSLFLLNTRLSNRILACILLVLAVRTGKSVVSLLIPETAYWVSVCGLLAMASLGPLILFYIIGLFTNETRLTRWNYIQLCP